MMSAESDRAIPMAVNPVSGESNSRRQRSEPGGEHHVGAAVAGHCVCARSRSLSARPAQGALLWALRRGNGPNLLGGIEPSTAGTGDVLAHRVDDADGMMGIRHPLSSTGAVRICTGKTE
jgi:hypothetical protein